MGPVIQLDLADAVLEGIVQNARAGKLDMQVCVGKKPVSLFRST